MAIPLPENVRQLLDRANFAHLATLMEDGSPHSTPVWVGREGDHIVIGTSGKSLKARNTRRDPRVAISMVDFQDPYMETQLRGRVVEQRLAHRRRVIFRVGAGQHHLVGRQQRGALGIEQQSRVHLLARFVRDAHLALRHHAGRVVEDDGMRRVRHVPFIARVSCRRRCSIAALAA